MNTRRARWIGGVAVLVLTAGCGDDYDPQVIEETQFAPSLGVDLTQMTRLESGVYIQDLVVGGGAEVGFGMTATVDFTLWLADGTLVDTIEDFTFDTQGENAPPPGFVIGILGMKIGGTRLFLVPPALGYGEHDQDEIPAGSILVFEVELLDATTG